MQVGVFGFFVQCDAVLSYHRVIPLEVLASLFNVK